MNVEPSEFIKEIAGRLHGGSMQFEHSLLEFCRYLKLFFPLDMLFLATYHVEKDVVRYLAQADNKEGLHIDEKIQLSEEAIDDLAKMDIKPKIFNNSLQSDLIKEVGKHFNFRRIFSTLVMGFPIEQGIFGGLVLVGIGENRFLPSHTRLLKKTENPVSEFVSNLLHYREVLNKNESLIAQNKVLLKKLGYLDAENVIGSESGLREVMLMVKQVAPLSSPVLITGETGTGKELIASSIHRKSGRRNGPFIAVNCGAIPETLIDSELFGYEKGAFTGAANLRRGYFEQADTGTIFLDEIGELPLQAQVKLLRVLQDKSFHRLGGSRPISVDIRVIVATHRDLPGMIKAGTFREDLWFRLNVFPIYIPPLRARLQDIPAIAQYCAARKALEMNLPSPSFGENAYKQLQSYGWPGNVRELQNIIERALILGKEESLEFSNLETPSGNPDTLSTGYQTGPVLKLDEVIANHIKECLDLSKGKIEGRGGAAQLLGLHPSTLRGKMKKLGIT